MKVNVICIAFVSLLIFASCKKYENGPALSLRSKKERVANNWRISQVTENGSDVTDDYQAYHLSLTKSGGTQLSIKYVLFNNTYEYTTSGTWEFEDKKEKLYFNYDNDDADATYRITKLYEDEMWLKDESKNREFHLVPQ